MSHCKKVKAHTGDPGNERAGQNAEKGIRSRTNVGRLARFPCTPLPPLPVSPALERFKDLDTTAQSSELIAAGLTAAEDSFPTLPSDQRKPYLSASTFQLVKKVQLTSNADAFKNSTSENTAKLSSRQKAVDSGPTRGRQIWEDLPKNEKLSAGLAPSISPGHKQFIGRMAAPPLPPKKLRC